MSEKGWVKLHRKLKECWIWTDEEPFDKRSAWVDLILSASHSDKKILLNGTLITVKRGQVLISTRKLAERWKWSVNKVYRYLKLLQNDEMLQKESNKDRTLLTIINYEVYQIPENTNGNTDDTPTNTVSETLSETESKTPTEHIQECMKNDKELIKNDKNVKNINTHARTREDYFDLDAAAKKLFDRYPNKNNFVSMRIAWLQKFEGVPESSHRDVANLIWQAMKAYLEDYGEKNEDEPRPYKYLKSCDKWLFEDCDYWMEKAREEPQYD